MFVVSSDLHSISARKRCGTLLDTRSVVPAGIHMSGRVATFFDYRVYSSNLACLRG